MKVTWLTKHENEAHNSRLMTWKHLFLMLAKIALIYKAVTFKANQEGCLH